MQGCAISVAVVVSSTSRSSGVMLPLIGAADLVAKGWSGLDAGATLASVPGLAPASLWAVVFGAVIARFFRWEPRA